MTGMLEGIRVLEWGIMHMVPATASVLGDLGAEVIKIESRLAGDPQRGIKTMAGGIPVEGPGGRSYSFEAHNRSKKSLTVDLKQELGREIVYRLVQKSDVFVTGFRRDAIARCGMTYEILGHHNPRLVYARGSAYGPRGPDSDEPGFDYAGQARAGLMTLQRSPDQVPSSPIGLADQAGSITLAFGILGALLARERYGFGQEVDASLLGSVMWFEATSVGITLLAGQEPRPINRETALNPLFNVYRTQDRKWLCLSHGFWGARLWPQFCQAVGIEELEKDSRFDTHDKRLKNGTELIPVLDRVFASRPRDEWLKIAKKWGLVFQPVNAIPDLLADPQALENNYIIDYDHPALGNVKLPGFPVQFGKTAARVQGPAPELGQHTEEILVEVAGYTWEEIERLRDQEVI